MEKLLSGALLRFEFENLQDFQNLVIQSRWTESEFQMYFELISHRTLEPPNWNFQNFSLETRVLFQEFQDVHRLNPQLMDDQ